MGRYVLLPCLKYYGIQMLDAVFVSHPDADHTNGIEELLQLAAKNRIRIGQLILPAIAPEARKEQFSGLLSAVEDYGRISAETAVLRVGWLGAGESWSCRRARFLCLHPEEGYPADNKNAYSLCLYVELEAFSLLLTGDVEGQGESALAEALRRYGIREVTVLKTAHHGSASSTGEELLNRISPRLAVISCGKNNRYGHPHREVLDRLEAAECAVVRTAGQGAVILRGTGSGIRVRRR